MMKQTLLVLLVPLALLATSNRLYAQDMRIDDPPDPAQPVGGPSAVTAPLRAGLLAEPRLLSRGIQYGIDTFGEGGRPKEGWYPELSNMITGSGFVSLGPGYRHYLFDQRAFVDGSAALS